MVDGTKNSVLLCCFLWAQPGLKKAMAAYEDRVLAVIPEHDGSVLQRAATDGEDGRPDEIQLLRFGSRRALAGFMKDPRRLALAPERDRVVARTELFPVELI